MPSKSKIAYRRRKKYIAKKKRYFRKAVRPRVQYDKAIKVTFDRQVSIAG